jgi:transposase InsO family protein
VKFPRATHLFVERLWRSLKYEEVYLKAYDSVKQAKAGIGQYISFYNQERQHQALGYKAAWEAHNGLEKQPWTQTRHRLIDGKEKAPSLPLTQTHLNNMWNPELSLNMTSKLSNLWGPPHGRYAIHFLCNRPSRR